MKLNVIFTNKKIWLKNLLLCFITFCCTLICITNCHSTFFMVSELVNVLKLEFLRPWLKVIIFFVLLSDFCQNIFYSNYQDSITKHELSCGFRRVQCVHPSCKEKITFSKLFDHLKVNLLIDEMANSASFIDDLTFFAFIWKGYLIFVVSTLFIIVHKFLSIFL